MGQSDTFDSQDQAKTYTKKTISSFMGLFVILYALCIQWQLFVSLGLGQDNINDMLVGLIPAVGAVVLALALYVRALSLHSIILPAVIGISWIVTGPLLSYRTLINGNTVYLNNIYDIYNGLVLFAVLFLISMAAKQYIPRIIAAILMTALSFSAGFINLVQWM